jgi:serine/threonine protein kinase
MKHQLGLMSCFKCGKTPIFLFCSHPVCSETCQKALWDGWKENVKRCLIKIGNMKHELSNLFQKFLVEFPLIAQSIVNENGEIDDMLIRNEIVKLLPSALPQFTDDTRHNLYVLWQLLRGQPLPERDLKVYPDVEQEYETIGELGTGKFGRVVKARNRRKPEPFCALKLIDIETATHGRTKRPSADREHDIMRFLIEEFGHTKPHGNLVGFHGAFAAKSEGVMYMVLKYEFMDGQTLQEFCNKKREDKGTGKMIEVLKLKPDAILEIAIGVFSALRFLHSLGIAHRDFKPDNVVWNPNMNIVTVLDLGLSCFVNGNGLAPCFDGPVKGTYLYMSPEILKQDFTNSKPTIEELLLSDVWAVGVTLFQLLTQDEPIWFNAKIVNALRGYLIKNGAETLEDCRTKLQPLTEDWFSYKWIAQQTMNILKLETRPNAEEMHNRFYATRYGVPPLNKT